MPQGMKKKNLIQFKLMFTHIYLWGNTALFYHSLISNGKVSF